MSRRTTTLFLPCETFEVDVLAGPSEVVSPIERLALSLVAEKIESVRDLDGLIGLGQRPTLDLVFGLWKRGYLSLDPASGKIGATAHVRKAIEEGRLDSLAGGELKSVRVALMQELVAGTVVAATRSSFSPSGYKTAPPLLQAGTYRRTPPAGFRPALERAINRRNRSSRPLKVFQSSLPLDLGATESPAGRRAFLRLELACSKDPDSGRLNVRVLFPTWLPFGAQAAIGAGLTRVVERFPNHPAVATLQDQLETTTTAPPRTPRSLTAALEAAASGLADLPAPSRFDRHGELVDLSEAAARLLGTPADHAQTLRPVVGAAALDAAMTAVARSAEHQLVLACPWIRPGGFQPWYRLLKKQLAAKPSLRVFVFWGISPSSRLDGDGPLAEWFADLRSSGRFHLSPRPSNTHAKLAIADARAAVVSSFNFLGRAPGDVVEVGVRAESTDPRLGSPIALDLLQFSIDLCPEHATTLALMTEPEQWDLERAEAGPGFDLPSLPPEVVEEETDESAWTRNARWGIWAHEWRGRATEIADAIRTRCRTAELVRDGEHGQLLWSELRHAASRVVVTSDQAAGEIVNETFLTRLLARSPDRQVALAYSRVPDALHEAVTTRVGEAGGAVVRCGEDGPTSHAKLLVADDRVLVTSFNLLSFSGDYEGEGRYTLRSEVGVLVRDAAFVRELTEGLVSLLPALGPTLARAPVKSSPAEPGRPVPAGSRARLTAGEARRLHGLLSELQRDRPEERGDAIREWLRGGEPWQALPVLRELEFGELPALVALALRECEGEAGPEWDHWMTWWTERAWHDEGSAIRAAAGLARLGRDRWAGALPPAAVAELQWNVDFAPEPPSEAFDEAVVEVMDDLTEGVATGLLAAGLHILLRSGAVEESCEILAPLASAPLGRWFEHVVQFRKDGWQRSLPRDEVVARVASADAHRRSEKARAEARSAIHDAGQEGLWDFVRGRETRPYLFGPEGEIARVDGHLANSDVAAARAWLSRHKFVLQLMDEATAAGLKALRPELTGVIIEPRRTQCERRLLKVRKSVKAWLDSNPRAPVATEIWGPTLRLAASLQEDAAGFSRLVRDSTARRAPEGPMLGALQTWLAPLLELEEGDEA